MKKTVQIKRIKKDPYLFDYAIENHRIVIFRVQSSMPLYPWRISIDGDIQNTQFMNQYNAENFLISHLASLPQHSNHIFTFVGDSSSNQDASCECGKEKHKFFKHSDWCPKSK